MLEGYLHKLKLDIQISLYGNTLTPQVSAIKLLIEFISHNPQS